MMTINYLAVFLCAIFTIFFGYLWFGIFFRDILDQLSGVKGEQKPDSKVMAKSMLVGFISSLFSCFFFAICIEIWRSFGDKITGTSISNFSQFQVVLIVWFGVSIPFYMEQVAWEFESWISMAIHSFFELVKLTVLALIFWNWHQ